MAHWTAAGTVRTAETSHDGAHLGILPHGAAHHQLRVLRLPGLELARIWLTGGWEIARFQWSPANNRALALLPSRERCQIWDLDDPQWSCQIDETNAVLRVHDARWIADGLRVIIMSGVSGIDSPVLTSDLCRIWDTSSGQCIFNHNMKDIVHCSMTPCQSFLAMLSIDPPEAKDPDSRSSTLRLFGAREEEWPMLLALPVRGSAVLRRLQAVPTRQRGPTSSLLLHSDSATEPQFVAVVALESELTYTPEIPPMPRGTRAELAVSPSGTATAMSSCSGKVFVMTSDTWEVAFAVNVSCDLGDEENARNAIQPRATSTSTKRQVFIAHEPGSYESLGEDAARRLGDISRSGGAGAGAVLPDPPRIFWGPNGRHLAVVAGGMQMETRGANASAATGHRTAIWIWDTKTILLATAIFLEAAVGKFQWIGRCVCWVENWDQEMCFATWHTENGLRVMEIPRGISAFGAFGMFAFPRRMEHPIAIFCDEREGLLHAAECGFDASVPDARATR